MEKKGGRQRIFAVSWLVFLVYYFLSVVIFTYLYRIMLDKSGTLAHSGPWTYDRYPIFVLESLYWRMFKIWSWTLIARIVEFLLLFLFTITIAYKYHKPLFRVNFLKLCFAFCMGSVASFVIAITSIFGDWYTDYGILHSIIGPTFFTLFLCLASLIWVPHTLLLLFSLFLTYTAIIDRTIRFPDEFPRVFALGVPFLVIAPNVSHGIGLILSNILIFVPFVSPWFLVLLGSVYLATIDVCILYIANRSYEIRFQAYEGDNR